MGIYKRKQEGKKTRKHAFDQENDQEKKKKEDQEKKKKLYFFLDRFVVKSLFSFLFSYFLVFLYKFPLLTYYQTDELCLVTL